MDIRIRAISNQHNVKISIVDLSEAMQKITELQGTNPLASIVLSKVTIANCLLGLELKNGERMSSNIMTTDGMVKKIISEFQNDKVRSFIEVPDFDLTLIAQSQNPFVATLGKNGTLTCYQDLQMKDPYVSRIDLIDGTVDGDYMEYLKTSNQIKSFIATKTVCDEKMQIKKAIGILVQLLPDHSEEDIDYLESKIGNTNFITDILMKSTNYEAVIKNIVDDAIVLDVKELKFECTCSHEKILDVIKILDQQELKKIIAEDKSIEVICEFCNKKYEITINEIKPLLN